VSGRGIKKEEDENLAKLRHDEETKWAQHAKVKHVQQGGNNIKYFHVVGIGKHKKKIIFKLELENTFWGTGPKLFFIVGGKH
jgi:hypothetical protein